MFTLSYSNLSGPIMANNEFEMVSPLDGFPLLGRQEKLGTSMPTIQTAGSALVDLKRRFENRVALVIFKK